MPTDDVSELEQAVHAAELRIETLSLEVTATRGAMAAWNQLGDAIVARVELDRALARARGEEVAVPYAWDPPWTTGAPSPHVVASGHKTWFMYLAKVADPDWDGRSVRVIDTSELRREPLVLVEVLGCYGHRFGGPNDEVFDGHPLARRGFYGQGAYRIERSRWLEAERATNQVHAGCREERWNALSHHLFAFHDQIFECLATGFRAERIDGTFQQVLARMVERVL